MMSLLRRSVAEFAGTFWLVLGGCGSAVLAAAFPGLGIGFAGVALAFGLTVLTMAYALGPIWAGSLGAATVLYLIARGAPEFSPAGGCAANGYGAHSPGHYSLGAAALCEVVMTLGFVAVIMGATDLKRAPAGFAPIAIGLALTLVHLVSIPVTNTSVNPARSTGVALYAGSWALRQLWLFWLAPMVGGALGGLGYRVLAEVPPVPLIGTRSASPTAGTPPSPSQARP